MRLLTHKETKQLVEDMERAALPQTWDAWHKANNRPAIVYFPAGELMNDAILGFIWAWKMKDRIVLVPPSEQDKISGLNSNGLEGLIQVETDLCVALMVYRDLPPYRTRVRA
ncbi:MAG: hypothetical protein ACYTGS_12175 [Planctomycetota bacterium]|jgi:hypothetical protein